MTGSNPVTIMLLRFTCAHLTGHFYYRTLTFREGGIGDNMKKNGYAQKKDAPVFCRLSPHVTEPGRNDAPSVAEDQKQENDHNDPDESVVAEEIAKASHEETSGPEGLIFRSAEAGDSRLHCHGMRLFLPV